MFGVRRTSIAPLVSSTVEPPLPKVSHASPIVPSSNVSDNALTLAHSTIGSCVPLRSESPPSRRWAMSKPVRAVQATRANEARTARMDARITRVSGAPAPHGARDRRRNIFFGAIGAELRNDRRAMPIDRKNGLDRDRIKRVVNRSSIAEVVLRCAGGTSAGAIVGLGRTSSAPSHVPTSPKQITHRELWIAVWIRCEHTCRKSACSKGLRYSQGGLWITS
jgi:hypothetical protein